MQMRRPNESCITGAFYRSSLLAPRKHPEKRNVLQWFHATERASERAQTWLSGWTLISRRGRRVGERERGIEWRNLLQRATEGGRERDDVRRKKEWMGALCARWLGGVAASRRRTISFYTLREIRSHCYFITGRDPRSYNTKGLTDDNCHAIDLWQSTAFYDSLGFIAMRFLRNLRESKAWAPFIPRSCRKYFEVTAEICPGGQWSEGNGTENNSCSSTQLVTSDKIEGP